MAGSKNDSWFPGFVQDVAVANGTDFVTDMLALDGAAAVSMQILLMGGAKGDVVAEATNMDIRKTATDQAVWVPCQTITLGANEMGYMVFSPVDQLCSMAYMRLRFKPTADGTVTAAINMRHTSY